MCRHSRSGGDGGGRGSSKRTCSRLLGVVRIPSGAAVGAAASDVVFMRQPKVAAGAGPQSQRQARRRVWVVVAGFRDEV